MGLEAFWPKLRTSKSSTSVGRSSRASQRPERLVIFLGHHKTGSTALQDFLARNSQTLAKHGVLYPYVDFEGAAFNLYGTRTQTLDDLPLNVREPHNAWAFSLLEQNGKRRIPEFHRKLPSLKQMEHALEQQLRFLRPHTVVLASEVFANFGADAPDLISRIAERFPAKTVTLYASFRRIDEYLVSWYGQQLKFGAKLPPLEEQWKRYLPTIHFDYSKVLRGWKSAFPNADIRLRNYEDVRRVGIVEDFFAQMDLPMPQETIFAKRSNLSIHPVFLELQRLSNRILPPERAARMRDRLQKASLRIEAPKAFDIELYGDVLRSEIADQFTPIDRALGIRAGRSEFFGESIDIRRTRPVPYREVTEHIVKELGHTNDLFDSRDGRLVFDHFRGMRGRTLSQ